VRLETRRGSDRPAELAEPERQVELAPRQDPLVEPAGALEGGAANQQPARAGVEHRGVGGGRVAHHGARGVEVGASEQQPLARRGRGGIVQRRVAIVAPRGGNYGAYVRLRSLGGHR
jgi:hypothetical protein